MIRSRKAGIDDIALIRDLAEKSFLPTYKEILSADQLDWMFDWMYSADSLRQQIEDGHVFFIAYDGDRSCGYVSVERQGEALFHLQKIYVLPDFQGETVGAVSRAVGIRLCKVSLFRRVYGRIKCEPE